MLVRENTEGLYSGVGGILAPGGISQVGTDTRIITRRASERVIRRAFEIAMKRNGAPKDRKKRVTCKKCLWTARIVWDEDDDFVPQKSILKAVESAKP